MQVYTYSEARQKLAMVLEQAENTGKVLIRRKDGRTFALVPEKIASSPLNVPSIKANITTKEIVDIVREGRERQRQMALALLYLTRFQEKGYGWRAWKGMDWDVMGQNLE